MKIETVEDRKTIAARRQDAFSQFIMPVEVESEVTVNSALNSRAQLEQASSHPHERPMPVAYVNLAMDMVILAMEDFLLYRWQKRGFSQYRVRKVSRSDFVSAARFLFHSRDLKLWAEILNTEEETLRARIKELEFNREKGLDVLSKMQTVRLEGKHDQH